MNEIEQTGLGVKFEKEIKNGILRIQQFPQAWPPERKETRRYEVNAYRWILL